MVVGMEDKFTRIRFEKSFNVEAIITLFYMEFSKNFRYEGESHDFWEMVYIDKGEMICQADKKRFVLNLNRRLLRERIWRRRKVVEMEAKFWKVKMRS